MPEAHFLGERLLFIGAHPDDIELGCGALIARIIGQAEVSCVTFSDNQKNPLLTELPEEHLAAMAELGIEPEQTQLLKFETRRFSAFRQEILETLIQVRNAFKPDVVFVHSSSDMHQDHAVLTAEALRAFRGTTLLGYEIIRSSHGFTPNFLVPVSESDAQKKINALGQYNTYRKKQYFDPQTIRALLIRNGTLCDHQLAEGFDILRMVADFRR